MMRLGATGGDDFITHLFRKGNIHNLVAVDVAQLTFAQTEFPDFYLNKIKRKLGPKRCGCAVTPLDKLPHQIDQTRSTYPTGPAQNGFMNFLSRRGLR